MLGSPQAKKIGVAKNARKMPQYLVLRGINILAAFAPQKHPILLYFCFLCRFYAQIGLEIHFSAKKLKMFLKAPSVQNIECFATTISFPVAKILGGRGVWQHGGHAPSPFESRPCNPLQSVRASLRLNLIFSHKKQTSI